MPTLLDKGRKDREAAQAAQAETERLRAENAELRKANEVLAARGATIPREKPPAPATAPATTRSSASPTPEPEPSPSEPEAPEPPKTDD